MGSRSANAMMVVKYLYVRPVVDAKKVSEICGITLQSSYNLIEDLTERGILSEITKGKRNRLYVMKKYLQLFN